MDRGILIVDFGSQYTQLIARRVRELRVYSEIVPYFETKEVLEKKTPDAFILSGGPRSVYEPDAPVIDIELIKGKPVLGICYGHQLLAKLLGGKVTKAKAREYGFSQLKILRDDGILKGVGNRVWMSHGDVVNSPPEGFIVSAKTENTPVAVMENWQKNIYGVQFHPEVYHTENGKQVFRNFIEMSEIPRNWELGNFIERKIKEIRDIVGNSKVICALSGGVDSTVTAVLISKAIGNRLHCIFVNNGVLRKSEFEENLKIFKEKLHLNVKGVDASKRFLQALRGVTDPERKRKIIGKLFIDIFEEEAAKVEGVGFLAQGTTYPDIIESAGVKGPAAVIKSHHNVGGLPEKMKLKLVEPLRELFKDEVREIGKKLGLDPHFIKKHPFPGPGLAVRIVGEVTEERLRKLREADAILEEELKKEGIYEELWQGFAVLVPVRTVGVMGDERTYDEVIALRLVQSVDGMTADWYLPSREFLTRVANRIVNEVRGINRVVLDISSKPPATIEWE
ncbi:MAG: glutamine-hydrolyzing GMP synthase [Candidatus Aminicenantes bacterium]|nr:glutamine-hydrolyzing GMP synthase [Candidatus Aminicenantes bacterium]